MRKIKRIAAVATLALAVGALGASTASAYVFFNPEGGNTVWTGSNAGASAHVLQLGQGSKFTCEGVGFSQVYSGVEVKTLTVPITLNCTYRFNSQTLSAQWAVNSCQYRFNPGGSGVQGTIDIVGCKAPMSWENTWGPCRFEIGNQNAIGSVSYENKEEAGHQYIKATPTIAAITWTQSQAGGCPGGPGTYHNGTYTGSWNIKGYDETGKFQKSVRFQSSAHFTTEHAGATFSGVAGAKRTAFMLNANGSISCNTTNFTGGAGQTEVTSISVIPTYGSCVWKSSGVAPEEVPLSDSALSFGGCEYTFAAGPWSAVERFTGSMTIGGYKCSTNPITISIPGCLVSIGPNTISNVSYLNQHIGEGVYRGVQAWFQEKSGPFTYTATGVGCAESGSHQGGMRNNINFTASNSLGEQQGLWMVE